MISNHQVPAAEFKMLGQGNGSPETIRLLRSAQLSMRLLQLRILVERSGDLLKQACDLLNQVQAQAPEVCNDLLLYPPVGTWTSNCLRRLDELPGAVEDPKTREPLDLDLLHLGAVAAAGAVRV